MAFGTIIIPYLKLGLILLFVVSFAGLIRLYKHLDAVSIAMITVISWTSILDLFPAAIIMSKFYDVSKEFSKNASEQTCYILDTKEWKLIELQVESLSNYSVSSWEFVLDGV